MSRPMNDFPLEQKRAPKKTSDFERQRRKSADKDLANSESLNRSTHDTHLTRHLRHQVQENRRRQAGSKYPKRKF